MVYGRIASLVGPFVRSFARTQSRNIYNVLKIQDRIIDKTYRKAGLYNRGIVQGIKHGLIAGQVIGGTLNLGLQGVDDDGFSSPTKPTANKQYKKYQRNFQYNRSYDKYKSTNFRCRSRKRRSRYY